MSSIMATLREQMEEDEDLVLLFVKRREDNKVEHKVGQKVDYGASEFTPNLPEGISIRGRSTRSSSNVVTSCYVMHVCTMPEQIVTEMPIKMYSIVI